MKNIAYKISEVIQAEISPTEHFTMQYVRGKPIFIFSVDGRKKNHKPKMAVIVVNLSAVEE